MHCKLKFQYEKGGYYIKFQAVTVGRITLDISVAMKWSNNISYDHNK